MLGLTLRSGIQLYCSDFLSHAGGLKGSGGNFGQDNRGVCS